MTELANRWAVIPAECAPTSMCAAWHMHPYVALCFVITGFAVGALIGRHAPR